MAGRAGRAESVTAVPVDVPSLYSQHWRSMVRLAVLLVDDVQSAEDIVQEAFTALHRNAGSLRDREAALGYVRASIVNLSRSVIRRRQVARRAHPLVWLVDPEQSSSADSGVMQQATHAHVLAELRRLPQRQQEVLVLRYWSDLSEAQIADALGISAGAVKSSASRGMASLRENLRRNETDGVR